MPGIQVLTAVITVGKSPDQNVHPSADFSEVAEVFVHPINPADQLASWPGHVLVAREDATPLHGFEQPHHAYIRTVM